MHSDADISSEHSTGDAAIETYLNKYGHYKAIMQTCYFILYYVTNVNVKLVTEASSFEQIMKPYAQFRT